MARVIIIREHRMGLAAVRKLAQQTFDKYGPRIRASGEWDGDQFLVSARGAAWMRVHVEEQAVTIDLRLGRMLSPFRRRIEQAIEKYLDDHLQ